MEGSISVITASRPKPREVLNLAGSSWCVEVGRVRALKDLLRRCGIRCDDDRVYDASFASLRLREGRALTIRLQRYEWLKGGGGWVDLPDVRRHMYGTIQENDALPGKVDTLCYLARTSVEKPALPRDYPFAIFAPGSVYTTHEELFPTIEMLEGQPILRLYPFHELVARGAQFITEPLAAAPK